MYARPDTTATATIGELVSIFYQRFMELYGDADIASVAAAAVINDLLADMPEEVTSSVA